MNNNYQLINIYLGEERILHIWMYEINQDFIVGIEEER